MKREVQTRPIYECRCDERLKTKTEESTRLTYTGFLGELEHLKIETSVYCSLRIDKVRAKDKTHIRFIINKQVIMITRPSCLVKCTY